MGDVLEFISFVPWTFIVMMANVYILYRLLRHFLFKPVQAVFKKRQEEVDALYSNAEQLRVEAGAAKEQYESKLTGAQNEAKEIMSSTVAAAQKKEKEILSGAEEHARRIVEKAKDDVAQVQRKAAVELQSDISDMAIAIAQKVTEKEISQTDHERLIEDCIRRFQEDAG